MEKSEKELFSKDFRYQITVKTQKQSKEFLFNVFQQPRGIKSILKGLLQIKYHFFWGGANLSCKHRSDYSSCNSHNKALSETQLTRTATFKKIPQLVSLKKLSSAHTLVKELFCNLKIPTSLLPGMLVHVLDSWEKLAKFQNILQIVRKYQIPFVYKPKRNKKPR